MPFDDYLGDLVQLLAPLRWGYALCLLSIQPEPQGRGFELSFEIRDGRPECRSQSRFAQDPSARTVDPESLEPHA
jgi:hypothetical protein